MFLRSDRNCYCNLYQPILILEDGSKVRVNCILKGVTAALKKGKESVIHDGKKVVRVAAIGIDVLEDKEL